MSLPEKMSKNLSGDDKARYVGTMFSKIVARYDLMNSLMTLGQDRVWREEAARLAAAPAGGLALDLATGTGDLALALAAYRTRPRVIGLDFCAEMLQQAGGKIDRFGCSRTVSLVLGDAQQLPFAGGTFACATMGFGLRNVADIPQTLAEIHRVLRPGGRFANLELTPRAGVLSPLLDVYFHRLLPVLGGLVTGDRAAYTYLPESVKRFPDAEALRNLMRAAGFRAVSFRKHALGSVAIHLAIK